MSELDDRLEKLRRLQALKSGQDEDFSPSKWEALKTGLRTTGDNLVRGATSVFELPGALGGIMSSLDGALSPGLAKIRQKQAAAHKPVEDELALFKPPVPQDESDFERYARKGTEAVGAGALMGPGMLLRNPIASAATNFAGGLGGEAGQQFGDKTAGEKDSTIGKIMSFLGSMGASLGTGVAASFRPPALTLRPQNDLRLRGGDTNLSRAAQGADFPAAEANRQSIAGVPSATLAEAFPSNSPLMGLAAVTRNRPGGETLGRITQTREEDLAGLGKEFLGRIGPPVEGSVIANKTVGAADDIFQNLSTLKNDGFGNRVQGAKITTADASDIYQKLRIAATEQSDEFAAKAYEDVAKAFRHQHTGRLVTDVQKLSSNLFRLAQREKDASGMNAGGSNVADRMLREPRKLAQHMLQGKSAEFHDAVTDAAAFNSPKPNWPGSGPRQALAESPLDRVASTNPNNPKAEPMSKLLGIFQGGSPQSTAQTLHSLQNDPGLRPGQGVDASAVLKAIFQEKLKKGPQDPGQTVRGAVGSGEDEALQAALRVAGRNPEQVTAPLVTADRLQGMRNPPFPDPFRGPLEKGTWVGKIKSLAGFDVRANKRIAETLGPPTRENLERLIMLAQFDPSIRRQLIAMGVISPQVAATQE